MIKIQYEISNPVNIYPSTPNITRVTLKNLWFQKLPNFGTHNDCCNPD